MMEKDVLLNMTMKASEEEDYVLEQYVVLSRKLTKCEPRKKRVCNWGLTGN